MLPIPALSETVFSRYQHYQVKIHTYLWNTEIARDCKDNAPKHFVLMLKKWLKHYTPSSQALNDAGGRTLPHANEFMTKSRNWLKVVIKSKIMASIQPTFLPVTFTLSPGWTLSTRSLWAKRTTVWGVCPAGMSSGDSWSFIWKKSSEKQELRKWRKHNGYKSCKSLYQWEITIFDA